MALPIILSATLEWSDGVVVSAPGRQIERRGFDSHSTQNICAMSIEQICV